jgi:hypothetical protein
VQDGYVPERGRYRRWLERGALILSTADQENFGFAVVEAVRRGCFPLLPARLSYPELIPETYHGEVLYASEQELVEKLVRLLEQLPLPHGPWRETTLRLAKAMDRFAWDSLIGEYDAELERLAGYGTRAMTSRS